MKRLIVVALLVGAACFRVDDDITNPATNALRADIRDTGFSPETVTVSVGRSVRWTNRGSAVHDVTAGSFASAPLGPGAWFEVNFDAPGTVEVHCSIHSAEFGAVIVQ